MMRNAAWLALWCACGGGGDALDAPVSDSATPDAAVDAAIDDALGCPAPRTIAVATASEVTIVGEPGAIGGIFDPSVVYPAGAPGGALAYSAVLDQHTIRTRIALSPDAGASWTYVADANAPEAAAIASPECTGGTCSGFLISEVPTLVLDPTEPDAAKRWKLFAHRYLAEPNNALHYRIGVITMQTAAQPQGPWTAPQKLFGVPSPSAYTTTGVRYDASAFTGFTGCLVLTEPSAIVLPGALDLAMGCVYQDGATSRIRIVLARSTDHGATWSGVGRMLEPGAASCLPGGAGASVNAPDLFVGPDGNEYLSATGSLASGYNGCAIFRIADPVTGRVAPIPVRTIVPDTGQFSGACTWSAGGGGYLIDLGFLTSPRPFRIVHGGAPL